ncbi:hypothetical protein AB0N06_24335 [Streptomyces sp. NPDC051020]|uniref:hypothetical protein n=1 Tax=Streptomyces sp. NPDC051020 TaxID=3155409 RepID=UPI00343E873B
MAEQSHLRETRASCDTVAVDHAEFVRPAFEGDLLGRAMLGAFAELVQAIGGGPVTGHRTLRRPSPKGTRGTTRDSPGS